jgi:hypothetical protein
VGASGRIYFDRERGQLVELTLRDTSHWTIEAVGREFEQDVKTTTTIKRVEEFGKLPENELGQRQNRSERRVSDKP